jgi:membrane protein DedA with SNARE-associated domain
VPDWPAVPLFVFLVAVAFGRGGATYAVGRGGRGLTDRYSRLLDREAVRRAEDVVRRYGAPAVTLCFLTVGVQTAVNAAAGSLRMPLRRYLPALLAGALVWATIYFTIGLAAIEAIWGGRSGLLLAGAVVALVAALLLAGVVRRRLMGGRDPD